MSRTRSLVLHSQVLYEVRAPCRDQEPLRSTVSGPQTMALFVTKGQVAAGTIQIRVISAATQSHGDFQAGAIAEDHFWVHGPTVVRVSANSQGLGLC